MRAITLAAMLLFAVACGQVQGKPSASLISPSSSVHPTASPGSSQNLLFAVLESRNAPNAYTYNTVVIAGLDGRERATASFAPMPVPVLSCMGALLPPSAQVAAGKVFYADAQGVVRSLAPDGAVVTAATFPLTTTQQMLSFAVSPDGAQLLGTVYTIPTTAFSCGGGSSGTFTFDAYSAANGGASHLVYHDTWTGSKPVLALTGWDAVGPIGTYPTIWASQGGLNLAPKVRVDSTSIKPLAQLADPSTCRVWDSVRSGAFVCLPGGTMTGGGTPLQRTTSLVSVRGADGTELWHSTVIAQNEPGFPYLAPDGQHVAICCNDLNLADPHELVVGRDGSQVDLPKGFYAAGWLDSATTIGTFNLDPQNQSPLPLAYVVSSAPDKVLPLGFAGNVVGTVAS